MLRKIIDSLMFTMLVYAMSDEQYPDIVTA